MGRAITKAVFKKIEERIHKKYGIQIQTHIADLNAVKVGRDTGQGITFTPKNHITLGFALEMTGDFRKDNKADVFGAAASAATKGEGWREVGKPGDVSLHCQVAKSSCNIHLDRIGFVAVGPDGKTYYTPEALQHIADELLMAKAADAAYKVHPYLGEIVARIHPVLPNINNKYKPEFGVQVELGSGESVDLKSRWKVTFDLTKTCKNFRCGSGAVYGGVTLTVVK